MRVEQLADALHEAAGFQPEADLAVGRAAIDRRVRSHERRRAGALSSVAMLVVAALVIGASSARRHEQEITVLDGTSVPHLLPETLPTNTMLFVGEDFPLAPGIDQEQQDMTIYARGSDPGALAGESFAVVMIGNDLPPSPLPPGTPEEIWRSEDGGLSTVRRVLGGPRQINVLSRTLPMAELEAIARSARATRDGGPIETFDVPPGFIPSSRPKVGNLGRSGIPAGEAGGKGSHLQYDDIDTIAAPGSAAREFKATVTEGDGTDFAGLLWLIGTRPAGAVNGHAAFESLGTPSNAPPGWTSRVIAWRETEEVYVVVVVDGATADEAHSFARSLRPATVDEWTAVRTKSLAVEKQYRQGG